MKTLTLAEYRTANIQNRSEYNDKAVEEAIQLATDLSVFHPAEVTVNVSGILESKPYFEFAEVYLIHPLKIRVQYDSRKKKYSFFAWEINKLKHINQYDISQAEIEVGQPNEVGVLSQPKVNTWIAFYQNVYLLLSAKNDTNRDKIQLFIDSLKGLPVHWYESGNKRGSIERNGLLFEFYISDTNVQTYLKIANGTGTKLSTFIKMSDNQLNK